MEIEKIDVKLEGISDIMFDRFIDHSKEDRPPKQKLYLRNNKVVFPAENIHAFMFGETSPMGCAKTFEGKKGKEYCRIGQGHIQIDPLVLPFLNDEKEIEFADFDDDKFWVHEGSPRAKGIKMEVIKRPVRSLPWSLKFIVTIIKNSIIDGDKLYSWFTNGGLQIGLGNYRPRFGRFKIAEWQLTK